MKYKVILTEAQLRELSQAADFLSRIRSGSLKEISYLFDTNDRQKVDDLLDELKKITHPELDANAAYGAGHNNENDILMDFWLCARSILHHKEVGNHTAWAAPFPTYNHSDEPLPEFEILDK